MKPDERKERKEMCARQVSWHSVLSFLEACSTVTGRKEVVKIGESTAFSNKT